MRQALNNLQSTHSGFGIITTENVFKVCDQPHPVVVQQMLRCCAKGDVDGALEKLDALWEDGYAAIDIVTTVFRVVKVFDECVFARRPPFPSSWLTPGIFFYSC
jgi:replication factor C subunit 2/4